MPVLFTRMSSLLQLLILSSWFALTYCLTGPSGGVCSYYVQVSYKQSYSEKYYTSCGFFGWDRCTRYRTKYRVAYKSEVRYKCCTGYKDNGNSYCAPLCFNSFSCPNGGTCAKPDYCTCKIGFYSPRCYACPVNDITYCAKMTCDAGPTNKICTECQLHSPSGGAYLLTGNQCLKKCSWLSYTRCWPGTCNDRGLASSCSCSSGFKVVSGGICQLESIFPNLLTCETRAVSSSNEYADSKIPTGQATSCANQQDYYSNFSPVRVNYKYTFQFKVTGLPSTPSWIADYHFGTTAAYTQVITFKHNEPSGQCFQDSNSRLLPYTAYWSHKQSTVETCVEACRSKGYKYAGPQYHEQCFCGNTFDIGKLRPQSECNTKCRGSDDMCGGSWRLSIYFTTPYKSPYGSLSSCTHSYSSTYGTIQGSAVTCTSHRNFEGIALQNGYKYCMLYEARGGGYFRTRNTVNNAIGGPYFYPQVKSSNMVCMLYDSEPPTHCSQTNSCPSSASYRVDPVGIATRITKDSTVTVTYGGWSDPVHTSAFPESASGVDHLELGLYGMVEKSSTLIGVGSKIGSTKKVSNGAASIQFALPGQGLYAVILDAKDIANNVRRARRFVLYDPTSKVVISTSHPLRVTSAAANTNYLWQTNHGKVTVQWSQHFYNDFHVHNNMLRQIQADVLVSGYYDQTTGVLPVSGTPNVDGITEFNYGINSLQSNAVPPLSLVTPARTTSLTLSPTMQDGLQYKIWIQATDIMGNKNIDSATLSIDSTPPIISKAGVVNNGKKELFVHSDSDLSKMSFEFNAMDSHSGLHEVKWKLGTTALSSDISQGSIAVKTVDKSTPNHYCPIASLTGSYCENLLYSVDLNHLVAAKKHTGNHNREYFFTLTATNKAMLSNNPVTVKILVDISAPTTGVVFDGDSSQDVQFQSDRVLKGKWHGFVDHESGVEFYKYAFAEKCLSKEELVNSSTTTTVASGSGMASKDGKYFLSVVAYNGANEPSDVACSNGVVVDSTDPKITDLYIHGLYVHGGIVCDNGVFWYVLNNFTRVSLTNEASCQTKCTSSNAVELLIIPKLVDNNGTTISYNSEQSRAACESSPLFDVSLPKFIATDHFRLRWNSIQNTPILDYRVGIGATEPSQESTHGAQFYNSLKSGIAQGQKLNVLITATTKARKSSSLLFGPIFVDETPPKMSGQLNVNMGLTGSDPLLISWGSSTFFDAEYQNGIADFQYAIGTENDIQLVSAFTTFRPETSCAQFQYCITIDKKLITQHAAALGHNYVVSLKVFNKAGLYSIFKTQAFNVAPIIILGTVFDVTSGKTDQDVDFMPYNDYCVGWTGFKTHYGSIQYSVGLGTSKLKTDVIAYRQAPAGSQYLCLGTPSVQSDFTMVYATVKATSTLAGSSSVIVSSDGALVISKSVHLTNFDVYDGSGCESANAAEVLASRLIQPSQSHDVQFSYSEFLSVRYTVKLTSSHDLSTAKMTQSGGQPVNTQYTPTGGSYMALFTFEWTGKSYAFTITNTGSLIYNITSVSLLPCAIDDDFQARTTSLAGHWQMPSAVHQKVSHYECSVAEDTCTSSGCTFADNIVAWTPKDKQQRCEFNGLNLKTGNRYRLLVRPCFHGVCLEGSASNGVTITPDAAVVGSVTANVDLKGSSGAYVAQTSVQWQKFVVTSGALNEHVIRYEWTLSSSQTAKEALMTWRPVYDKTQDTAVITWKKHRLQATYLLLKGYSLANVETLYVNKIIIEKDSSTPVDKAVHDLSKADVERFSKTAHATNILTTELTKLHNAEVDFTSLTDKAYALFAGPSYDSYQWFLTTEANPSLDCSTNPRCLSSVNNTQNNVEFKITLAHGIKYFTCLRTEAQTKQLATHTENLPAVMLCSNGFVVDTDAPVKEELTVLSLSSSNLDVLFSRITDSVEFKFKFKDLEDNVPGISSGVKNYWYYIGTSAGQNDVVNKTNVGRQTHVIVENISLVSGKEYFVTVDAEDYAGHVTSVSSKPFQVDPTPPVATNAKLRVGSPHTNYQQLAGHMLQFHWFGFEDSESGIARYEFRIHPFEFKEYSSNYALVDGGVGFVDGLTYYPEVKVTNGAGSMTLLKEKFVFDSSPPSAGVVRECTSLIDLKDIDYQVSTAKICASWSGFHDPHTSISEYRIGVEEDGVQPILFSVGSKTVFIFDGSFKAGRKYVVTVEACNSVGLCATAQSDGVIIDPSPPIAGVVTIGHRQFEHSRYQASRKYFSASWMGFQDPQSGIHRFDWCIGTSVGLCDIQSFVNVHNAHEQVRFDMNLPLDKLIFVTVRAWNKASLSVTKTSDPIIVDNTPPIVAASPVFKKGNLMSLYDNSQFETNALHLEWKFSDTNSPLTRHIISVTSHHNGFCPVENLELGDENSLSISLSQEHTLADGDRYYAAITSCNDAGLCVSSKSSANVLIDSSGPHLGQFLQSYWSDEGGKIKLRIIWSGFVDPHSGIKRYELYVGSSYSSFDLTGGVVKVDYNPQAGTTTQETDLILDKKPAIGSSIYISMVAENNVGLKSKILKILATLVSTVSSNPQKGMLVVKKYSCDVPYCNNDCVCAPVGQKCSKFDSSSCTLLPNPPSSVTVSIGFTTPVKSAVNQRCVAAYWTAAKPESVMRYQYSLGVSGAEPGYGVFNLVSETVWHNVDLSTKAVFCLPQDKFFQPYPPQKYVFYVRAWYTSTTLAQFQSNELTIDTSAPVQGLGQHVLDCNHATQCTEDIEFSTDTQKIETTWKNVFTDVGSGISEYAVMVGVFPGDDSVKSKFSTTSLSYSRSGLTLAKGVTYYTTVKAVNSVGLTTTVSSDGVTVDNVPPVAGIVYNTKSFHSISATAGPCIGASWHGFDDIHSHIREYIVSVVDSKTGSDVLVNKQSVDIKDSVEFCNLNLKQNTAYVFVVHAKDAAGTSSTNATSDPILVDTTQPMGFRCTKWVRSSLTPESTSLSIEVKSIVYKADIEANKLYKLVFESSSDVLKASLDFLGVHHKLSFMNLADGGYLATYSYTASATESSELTVNLAASSGNITVSLDVCDVETTTEASSIVVLKQLGPIELLISFYVKDHESGIRQHLAGIGTTVGGFQVAKLHSLGMQEHMTYDMNLPHGTPVFATVISENNAGSRKYFGSKKLVVDHTPPTISELKLVVNLVGGSSYRLTTTWKATDPESGTNRCNVQIGDAPHTSSVQSAVTVIPSSPGVYSSTGTNTLSHGQKLYATAWCSNHAELSTTSVSQPATAIHQGPSASSASVRFLIPQTIYQRKTETIVNANYLHVAWRGFQDISSSLTYKVRILKGNAEFQSWVDVGPRTDFRFSNLSLTENVCYKANVQAYNLEDLSSTVVTSEACVDSTAPGLTGQQPQISRTGSDLKINWYPTFVHDVTLWYVVCIGFSEGACDVLQPLETTQSFVTLNTNERGLFPGKEIFGVITAVKPSGIFKLTKFSTTLQ